MSVYIPVLQITRFIRNFNQGRTWPQTSFTQFVWTTDVMSQVLNGHDLTRAMGRVRQAVI